MSLGDPPKPYFGHIVSPHSPPRVGKHSISFSSLAFILPDQPQLPCIAQTHL